MTRTTDRLSVRFGDALVGYVYQDGNNFVFEYADRWRNDADSYPLSYSMPLDVAVHQGDAVENYLWGLLPDNEDLLRRWARRFGVSPRNPLRLLAHMGEDCAGAATLTPAGDSDDAMSSSQVEWLNDTELCARISELAGNALGGRLNAEEGQFSLAGAQSKAAFRYDQQNDRWGIPQGQEPTTAILKPAMADYEAQAWNEHFCLSLAREVGLATARTRVMDVCGHSVLVVGRYDRMQDESGSWVRIHQEDMCQALAVHPSAKYERDGGPGIAEMMRVLDASGDALADRLDLLRAVLFNLLIAGTDAHAKNFGILWGAGSYMRLAPLYDVNSILPYVRPWGNQFDAQRVRLSMRIGGHYALDSMQLRHIERMADECKIAPSKVIREFTALVTAMPAAVNRVGSNLLEQGAPSAFLDRMATGLREHCEQWASRLDAR